MYNYIHLELKWGNFVTCTCITNICFLILKSYLLYFKQWDEKSFKCHQTRPSFEIYRLIFTAPFVDNLFLFMFAFNVLFACIAVPPSDQILFMFCRCGNILTDRKPSLTNTGGIHFKDCKYSLKWKVPFVFENKILEHLIMSHTGDLMQLVFVRCRA